MPIVIDDTMVEVMPEDKALFKTLGYKRIARAISKSTGYVRFLASNSKTGSKRVIKYKDLKKIKQMQIG